jgi:hypothetical protein
LSWDDTDLEKALCVYEKSKGFFEVLGSVGDPITVAPMDDVESIFKNANITKATKVSYKLLDVTYLTHSLTALLVGAHYTDA